MKLRSTTPVLANKKPTKILLVGIALIMAISAPIAMGGFENVFARDYDAEIAAVQKKISAYNKEAKQLGKKVDSLQTELAKLTNEKNEIQAKVDLTQKKHDKLKFEIKKNEEKITENKDALGGTIADLYVNSNTSVLEMLASSSNIGDYIDKQTQQNSVKDALTETIDEITQLQKELDQQKKDVEKVLNQQKNQRNALAKKEAERAQLMNETKGKESAYKNLSKKAKAKKAKIAQDYQAALARAYNNGSGGSISGGGSNGSYASWAGKCYVDRNLYSHGGNGLYDGEDPIRYACNQCTSFAAWSMLKRGYSANLISMWGNATNWDNKARALGFKVSKTPRANSIGVIKASFVGSDVYGHVVYVKDYNPGSYTVDIQQYNEKDAGGPGWGHYSTRSGVSGGTYDWYIYL